MKYKKISLIILSLALILIVSCQKIKPLDDTEFLKSIKITTCDDLDGGMSKGQDIFFPSYAEMYYEDPQYPDQKQRLIAPDQCINQKTLNEGKCLQVPKTKIQIRGHLKVECPQGYVCAQTVPEEYAKRITKYWNEIPRENLEQEIIERAEEPEFNKLIRLDEDEWQRLIEIERHERIQLDLSQATFGACVPEAEKEEKSPKGLDTMAKRSNIEQEKR